MTGNKRNALKLSFVLYGNLISPTLPTGELEAYTFLSVKSTLIDGDSKIDRNAYCDRHKRERRKQRNRQKRLLIMSTTLSQAFALWWQCVIHGAFITGLMKSLGCLRCRNLDTLSHCQCSSAHPYVRRVPEHPTLVVLDHIEWEMKTRIEIQRTF